jgi:hypothetical protein
MSLTNTVTDRKFEIAIFAMAALLLGGLGSLFKAPKAISSNGDQDIVYEMPRPKNFVTAGFDLNGREIDRDYINPFSKKAKKDEAKKDDKKTAAQAAADAKKKTAVAQKKAAATNKPKVAITVVNDKPHSTLSGDSGHNTGSAYGGAGRAQVQANTGNNGNTAVETDTNKTSPDQWRALLSAQPTSENLAKLIAALVKGEVDQGTYNTIVADLLSSSKHDVQALGVDAASYSYGVSTFSLVANKMDTLKADTKTQAQAYLMSYTAGTRLNILASALKSSDTETVVTAAEIVLQGYAQAKAGVSQTASTRPGRGETTGSSVANYTQFVTIFRTLATSNDAAIAGIAQTALGQIQTNVASL